MYDNKQSPAIPEQWEVICASFPSTFHSPLIFIYKTLEAKTRITLSLSPCSAELQRTVSRLTLGSSDVPDSQDSVWEAANNPSILCPFWNDQWKSGKSPGLLLLLIKRAPFLPPHPFCSSYAHRQTPLRLKHGKYFSIYSYLRRFSLSCVSRHM